MSFEQTLQQRLSEIRKRHPQLDEDALIARALNDDAALYTAYRTHQWTLPPAEPEARALGGDGPAETEALRRADGLIAKAVGDLGLSEALQQVFKTDPALYTAYVAEKRAPEDGSPDEPPATGHLAALTQEALALARMYSPHDPELGLLKVRASIAELRKLLWRKRGVPI